jgi:hypothetical protein
MEETIRERVFRVVAKHHNLRPHEVKETMYVKPEVRRAVLDELDGPELGSTSRISVGSLIVFFELLQQQKRGVQ